MEELLKPIREEYERYKKLIGDDDPYFTEKTLGIHDVLRAHFLIANHFYEKDFGLGGIGPKDIELLHSAVHRQHIGFGSTRKWETKFEISATLLFGLIMDHPFYDANKRTAFLSTLYLLQKCGRWPTIPNKEFEDFTVEVASHGINLRRRYKKLLKQGSLDPEIEFIAKFLKQNTRDIDKREYFITYRQLEKILKPRGFELENPRGNYIDLIKIEKRRGILRKSIEKITRTRIGTVGFPGASRQISKGDIKHVRRLTRLTDKDGVDSQSFYKGLDDMRTLIDIYEEPLMRLADR